MKPQQLPLALYADTPRTLDNFIVGHNSELLTHLRSWSAPGAPHVYLWGAPGCGRTHLVCAACLEQSRPVVQLAPKDLETLDPHGLAPQALIAVDDVDHCSQAAQFALFRLFNTATENGYTVLMTGQPPPLGLKLREDLRTRIGQALIFEVKPLSEDEKIKVLQSHAHARGLTLDKALTDYMLRYCRRDIRSLLDVFERLDRAALEHKRPLTVPLLRDIMQP
jgi:DnaA family protein